MERDIGRRHTMIAVRDYLTKKAMLFPSSDPLREHYWNAACNTKDYLSGECCEDEELYSICYSLESPLQEQFRDVFSKEIARFVIDASTSAHVVGTLIANGKPATQCISETDTEVSYIFLGSVMHRKVIPIDECCQECDDWEVLHFESREACREASKQDAEIRGFKKLVCPKQLIGGDK